MKVKANRINDLIVARPDIEWDFTCKYATIYTIEKDKTVTSSTLDHDFNFANGLFNFDFDFYETQSFRKIQQDPTFSVGQQVNFGSTFFLVSQQQLIVSDCKT